MLYQTREPDCQIPGTLETVENSFCTESRPEEQVRTCLEGSSYLLLVIASLIQHNFLEHVGMRCLGVWNSCCTEDNPCIEGDGDCDTDEQCTGELRCGQNNCVVNANFTDLSDCCEDFGNYLKNAVLLFTIFLYQIHFS